MASNRLVNFLSMPGLPVSSNLPSCDPEAAIGVGICAPILLVRLMMSTRARSLLNAFPPRLSLPIPGIPRETEFPQLSIGVIPNPLMVECMLLRKGVLDALMSGLGIIIGIGENPDDCSDACVFCVGVDSPVSFMLDPRTLLSRQGSSSSSALAGAGRSASALSSRSFLSDRGLGALTGFDGGGIAILSSAAAVAVIDRVLR